jgi:hypothetical protein
VPFPKKYLNGAGEARERASSSENPARAITVLPGSRTTPSPPTWSQCPWVRTTYLIGACVILRNAATASRAVSSVVPASIATTKVGATMKARFAKS